MKESFTIAKPHVSDAFYEKLMSTCEETDDQVTFSRKHLNSCMADLARSVMGREKSNFESYTMYYENLLRACHQNLYQKEQVASHFYNLSFFPYAFRVFLCFFFYVLCLNVKIRRKTKSSLYSFVVCF